MFRRTLALVAAVGVFYVLSVYGISDINSGLLKDGGESPYLDLQRDQTLLSSDALVRQASLLLEQDAEDEALQARAESLVLAALRQNPSSGRAASFLLSLYATQERNQEAGEIADLAAQLWPAHTYTRSRLAEYWLTQGRLDKLVAEWNVLLIRNPRLRSKIYPFLARLIQDDRAAALLQPYADNPPNWWPSFFAYLSRELPLPQLRKVYQVRMLSPVELGKAERRYYINRLVREHLWDEAHRVWFVGLTKAQSRYSGFVFDGGFESGVFNQSFGWRLSRSKNPKIKTDITYGARGRKALKVVLRGQKPLKFSHVSQQLLLEPGHYRLSLRYRADSFKAQRGLTWRLRCLGGTKKLLTETKAIAVSSAWNTLKAEFSVPSRGCDTQLLRLESTSRFSHEQSQTGTLWFDDITISKKREQQ
ncbi:MAG: hypothetical protein CSB47_08715 [Proteobacteria bacterium]|nr:MAG: hypothetical protein CSB47_08715 [Pseudomonadota bacterium]